MADELKSLYEQIGANETEMARYRGRLADRLPTSSAPQAWRPLLACAATLIAVASIAVLLVTRSHQETSLPQTQLVELRQLADEASPALIRRARILAAQDHAPDRWNAIMLLSLTESSDQAIRYAAQGVQEDPRLEFRLFYLELLLDQADEYAYNPERIEALMDQENDRQCLRLYRSLLHIAT